MKTAAETGGEYTLLEMELAPGGGNALHYHKAFTEEFFVISGQLGIEMDRQIHLLKVGESALAPINVPHRFFNQSDEPAVSRVELRPGQLNFEQTLQISYGLARDGKTNRKGFPMNPFHAALLFQLADTHMPWPLFEATITPGLKLAAAIAKKRGIDRQLSRYIEDW